MVLGAIVIILAGVLVINFFAKKGGETIPPLEVENQSSLPTFHTVQPGENLWVISEKYYGTGYNWVDIASTNEIQDPNDIEEGDTLSIPDTKPKLLASDVSITLSPFPTKSPSQDSDSLIEENEGMVYTVQQGDNLWSIAEKLFGSGYNWVDISQANKLTQPESIEVGDKLFIPDVEIKQTEKTESPSKVEPITGATYKVVKGDSLWAIAVRAYGDGYRWSEIARENNLLNPNIIHQGNILTLPR